MIKNKSMALETLKRKKLVNDSQTKSMAALNNLESLLSSIRSAKNEEQILNAYKYGTKALNHILNKEELKVESIDP